jgi:hypothetical protein
LFFLGGFVPVMRVFFYAAKTAVAVKVVAQTAVHKQLTKRY